jgi:tetratricopeptide (TPR) repeat protein
MRWSKRFGLQGSSRGRKFPLLLSIITITTIIIGSPSSLEAEEGGGCAPVLGKVVSLQGTVETQRAGTRSWVRITRLDTPVCEGDRLRAGRASRAAVFVHPENLIRLDQNSELSFSHTPDETFIEFFQDPAALAADETAGCGAGYVITRFPRKFRIRTPHVNAVVEGTEFLVALRCETTELAVFEGKVRAQAVSTAEEQVLGSGQVLAAGPVEPPAIRLLVRPVDAVQWALYYPPLTDAGVPVPSADECAQLPAGAIRQVCFAQRAEQSLRAGRVKQAEGEIAQALAEEPASGDALAIRAIVSVVKGDKDGARSAAQKAVEASPNSSRAWLALSYAQQAYFRLDDALKSVQRAAEISANSSLVQARLAEMYMSLGRTRDAEKAARRAVEANPDEERAHTVLGFVHLAQINVKAAQIDFQNALERDSTAPLPRLGLGLAIIRQGELVQGREQLEIAVALDPTNSLLRSYVGKAYYEENTKERDQLAATQFDLAKQLDPNDPTPWFYDSILKQTQNRPVDALNNTNRSVELNDSRAVFRSRLLLDEDLAARNTRLGRMYRELGFEQLVLSEAYSSLIIDPANFSGHRLLADAFLARPRHEVARVSELLQSQLWQPLNVTPIETQLIDEQPLILSGAGPGTIGLTEFNPLFVGDGLRLQASGISGSNRTHGDQVLLSGLYKQLSASFGQLHYETDGFQEGWGIEKDLYNAFFQAQFSPEASGFLEFRHTDQTQGDTNQNFYGPPLSVRVLQDRQLSRAGFRQKLTEALSVAVVGTQMDRNDTTEFPAGSPAFRLDSDESSGELQSIYKGKHYYLLLGGGAFRSIGTTDFIGFGVFPNSEATSGNVYGYAGFDLIPAKLLIEVGASVDQVEDASFPDKTTQLNPKLGLVFQLWAGMTMRAATFRTLRRNLIAEQTIEPTQVAGFNQFYNDNLATDAWRTGIGAEQQLSQRAFVGLELSERRLTVPQPFTVPVEYFKTEERDYRGYAYWAPLDYLAATIDYTYERITEDPNFAAGFVNVRTHKLPLGIRMFSPSSQISLQMTVTGVHQSGLFRLDPLGPDFGGGVSDFWLADLGLSYRLPRRHGSVNIEVRNLFDNRFDFQETDIFTPTLARERLAFARLTLAF